MIAAVPTGCLTVLGKPLPDGRGSATVALIFARVTEPRPLGSGAFESEIPKTGSSGTIGSILNFRLCTRWHRRRTRGENHKVNRRDRPAAGRPNRNRAIPSHQGA